MNKTSRLTKKAGLTLCSVFIVALTGYATNADRPHTTGAVSQSSGTVEQDYPVDSRIHWIDLVMERGAKLRLEDGSVWEIAAKDQFQTRDWRTAQKISVSRNTNDRHPFKLTNADKKTTAEARLAARSR